MGKLKKPVEINCGLIAFTVRDGIGAADPILIDTEKNVIAGRGAFSFKDESLAMAMEADAKTFSLFSARSEEHTSELQSLMRISYAVFCLKKKKTSHTKQSVIQHTPNMSTAY